jgi:hypothetical protein
VLGAIGPRERECRENGYSPTERRRLIHGPGRSKRALSSSFSIKEMQK